MHNEVEFYDISNIDQHKTCCIFIVIVVVAVAVAAVVLVVANVAVGLT